jgi:hypothetical protein
MDWLFLMSLFPLCSWQNQEKTTDVHAIWIAVESFVGDGQ